MRLKQLSALFSEEVLRRYGHGPEQLEGENAAVWERLQRGRFGGDVSPDLEKKVLDFLRGQQ